MNAIVLNKNAKEMLKKGGTSGCVTLGLLLLYDLCKDAMKKGYGFSVTYNPNGSVSVHFTAPCSNSKKH